MPDGSLLLASDIRITTGEWQTLPATADRPLLIVADVHGLAKHLAALHAHARLLIAEGALEDAALIHLGDLIDRGPASLETIDLARRGLGLPGVAEITLCGNHEQAMLLALLFHAAERGRACMAKWLKWGGHTVMAELGLSPDADVGAIIATIGLDRLRFLLATRPSFTSGGITCVHAGLNPAEDPETFLARGYLHWPGKRAESPLWIREGFLNHPGPLPSGHFIVHGHTVERDGPVLLPHRLGLDLGSSRTGRVCMAEIRGNKFRAHIAEQAASTSPLPASAGGGPAPAGPLEPDPCPTASPSISPAAPPSP
jgi:serine/threonine protein phosphatase 1